MYRYKFTDRAELEEFMRENLVSMIQIKEILHCSKQYLWEITTNGKLTPAISHNTKYKLYWKDDILEIQR